jgi:pimeloyl-ACP methyl ester carboxylesterase
MGETITGTAAGVPFTALPPADDATGPVPLVVTWHMMDAPCTDAAFAAALPMAGVPAWRVHLGLPMCGPRTPAGGTDVVKALVLRDAVLAYLEPITRQAAEEFPAALAELRRRLPVDGGPIGVVGGSLGGAVALRVLAGGQVAVAAAAVVNAAVRARSVVGMVEEATGQPYPWGEESRAAADRLDFVARAADIAAPLLVVSGELDVPALRADAADLVEALRGHARLLSVPGLAHPLAEQPGLEPAPQTPTAKVVDEALTDWFALHL